jgi:hypothetical protein
MTICLLEEPPCDSPGYRRYGAEHAIQLVVFAFRRSFRSVRMSSP